MALWVGEAFPWGTLLINASGSFVIGLFAILTGPGGRFSVSSLDARQFVMVGLCGGFTTFSSFSLQTLALFRNGEPMRASAYVLASVGLCLGAVWLGAVSAGALGSPKGV